MSDFFDEDEERNFFQRHKALSAVLGAAVLGGITFAATKLGKKDEAPRRAPEMTMVKLAPLPPPPPTPPPPPQQAPPPEPQEKMEAPVEAPDEKPVDEPPPAADLGTSVKGDGPPDGFGLRGGGGGGGFGRRGASTERQKWAWYAGQVKSRLADAVRNDRRTRSARLRAEARVWVDGTGRITRAQLAGSSGDPAADAALRGDLLAGLQLAEPPPKGMPMPIVLRVTAQRPN